MARVVKDYDVRRNEILDTAQSLFHAVGYDQTTVAMIIEKTAIAKGTFYHYFQSKTELLDGLVDRLMAQIVELLEPILRSEASAIQKFRDVYRTASALKMTKLDLLIPLLRVIYDEKNLVFLQGMYARQRPEVVPIYAAIIRQGVEEGVFQTDDADQAAEIVVDLWHGLGEPYARLTIELPDHPENMDLIRHKLEFYEDAVERILGAEKGSLGLWEAAGTWDALKEIETHMRAGVPNPSTAETKGAAL